MQEERQIARVNIAAKLEYLPAVTGFVRQVISSFGLSNEETGRLELVCEEACVNVIEHAFDAGETGSFDVAILARPGQIVVAVEDRGIPFDFRKLSQDGQTGLGTVLMKAFADEINFLNLGRQGKRVELVKNLPRKELEQYSAITETVPPSDSAPMPPGTPVSIRLLAPEESFALARCIYRCYGYTYMENIYYPELVREMIEAGVLTSFAAVAEDGEIIGHSAITRDSKGAMVGDFGKSVVDPRYRNLGLMGKLTTFGMDYARKSGMYGLYGEAAAVHPYSQKAAVSLGWQETGALLGFVPETFYFKKIQQEKGQQRTSVIIFYLPTNKPPVRDIYPPLQHLSIISNIYERLKIKRNLVTRADRTTLSKLPHSSRVDVRTHSGESWAFLHIAEFGADLAELVGFRLKELCLRHIDCIYIDLPLSHPATQQFCAALELLGFFYGAVIPELDNGDILRMQFLNNVEIQADEIRTASPTGQQMLDYVIKAWKANTH